MDGVNDRLLRESDLIRIIKQRYGLSACGIIEAIRDTPTANAIPITIPGENNKGKTDNERTHTARLENQAETTA